jgi:fatty-acyl-CoA synthase/feruloyl-CoA synthase
MPTIGGTALSNAARVGSREAVVAPARRWTWSQLNDDIGAAAAHLDALGLRKGDRLALLAANSPEFIIAAHAASRLGLIVVPVNIRLAAPEAAYIVTDCGAAALAFAPTDGVLATAVSALVPRTPLVSLGPSSDHPDLLSGDHGSPIHEDRADESDDAFILYTSGTTGRPKGSLMDHHRAVWAAMAQIVSLGLRDGDRYLHLAPMYHSGGVTFLNATTLLGGTHLVPTKFDAATVLDLVEEFGVNWLFGVPTMYQQILRCAGEPRDLGSWRVGVFGAAPMPAPAIEELLSTFPNVSFFQQCGQTEAGPTGIYSTMEQVRSRPDSSGHIAQPFIEARVVDEHGVDTPPGAVGELVFRGEAITKGYWGQPEATAEVLKDGWLHTGDLMHVHADGALRLVDRLKDVIITGGRNVYSAEVEQAIANHPDVVDVAVVGRPHPEWGATVTATVTVTPGSVVTAEELREHCTALIAGYKIPRHFEFGPVPRNATGKIQKHLLRGNEPAAS